MTTGNRSARALIASVALYSVVLGGSYAALAIDLASRGFGAGDIAVNAAMTPLGLFTAALLLPRLIRGPVFPWIIAAGTTTVAVLVLTAFTQSFVAWLVLRFLLGLAANTLFIVAESALMVAIPERSSNRFLSLYNGFVTGGYALGPLALAVAPVSVDAALLAGAVVVALSLVPILVGVPRRTLVLPPAHIGSGLLVFALAAPALVLGAAATAVFDNAAISLFPVFAMQSGYSSDSALILLAILLAGATLLQWPIGVLADRWNSLAVLRVCAAATAAACFCFAVTTGSPVALGLSAFVAGGAAFGAYSMVLALVKERFSSDRLVTANAALGVTWGLGAMIGVPVVGAGMDRADPTVFGPLTALAFLALLVVSFAPIASGRRLGEPSIPPDPR